MSTLLVRSLPLLAVLLVVFPVALAEEPGPNPPPDAYSEAHRFLFFAVLEGCYTDGLTDGDIDLIIPRDPKSGLRRMVVNFVVQCPLCNPAFDAFSLYSDRLAFFSQPSKRSRYKTFGPGLSAKVKEQLAKPGVPRRTAIRGLIQRWVTLRFENSSMTELEKKALRETLLEMRKTGEEYLQRFQEGQQGEALRETYQDWEECPTCSGAAPMIDVR